MKVASQSGRTSHSSNDIRARTRAYALRILRLYRSLPKSADAQMIGKQLFRSGTSVGAHIAEAIRAKSRADFACKIEGAQQELEETIYWFDLLVDSAIVTSAKLQLLRTESEELMAVLATLAMKSRQEN
jgi:four helix bundle protein